MDSCHFLGRSLVLLDFDQRQQSLRATGEILSFYDSLVQCKWGRRELYCLSSKGDDTILRWCSDDSNPHESRQTDYKHSEVSVAFFEGV